MNVRLYNGTVRCADHFDASSYQSETTDPCLYCGTTPVAQETETDQAWLEAQSSLIVGEDTRTVILDKIQCDRCANPATWKIVDGAGMWENRMCTDHGQEWFPELFPLVSVA